MIPTTIDDITAEWLTDSAGLPCHTAEVTQIGVGIGVSSALYRVRLTGDGCPDSVVVKLPALDEAAVFTSTILRMYIREVHFFEQLGCEVPVRIPTFHHAEVDEETSRFVVVMEDLGQLRCVDQLEGMDLADAEQAVDALARWHAQWWGRAEAMATAGLTVHLGDPIYPAVLPSVFAEGWAKLTAEHDLPASIRDIGPHFADSIAHLLADLAQEPTTLCHGDYRADNMLFDDTGQPALLDFQLIGTGSGVYDLAYFATQSLRSEDAAAHERRLFDRWCDGLEAGGVADLDREAEWLRYRKAALFCLVYPVVACRGMDLSDPRQRALIECMDTRFSRAVEQLDLVELL
ncbi:MAG: phosphotransferase [Acidimicrobiia bacterium]|nr:phosphotransferase [Acidimicrobiia bacterium]